MDITRQIKNKFVRIESTAKSVINPGDKLLLTIQVKALTTCKCKKLILDFPGILTLSSNSADSQFPAELQEGEEISIKIEFTTPPSKEGFGDITTSLVVAASDNEDYPVEWKTWISVFSYVVADESGLNDEERERLKGVVNNSLINAYRLLAAFDIFFLHFLHIKIPDHIVEALPEQMSFLNNNVPDPELFDRVNQGEAEFFSIEEFELFDIDECVQSDDKFEMEEVLEVARKEVDDA